jgi:Flp pilus assembly protein TadD
MILKGTRESRLKAEVLYQAGVEYLAHEQVMDAVAAFRAATALYPNHADAHHDLGVTMESLGNPTQAQASYLAALAADPGHRRSRRALQAIHRHASTESLAVRA